MVCFVSGAEQAAAVGSSDGHGSGLEIAGAERDVAVRGEDGAREPIPVASVATPAQDCTTAAMISTDRLMLLFEWVLPRARTSTGLRRTTAPPGWRSPQWDHVRSGDDSIDVADLVGENQLDVGRALDVSYIVGGARLTTRTVTAKVRSHARYGGGGDGRHDKCPVRPTDRPTGATNVRPPARGPLRDQSRSRSRRQPPLQ
jgi:hypothetical protein